MPIWGDEAIWDSHTTVHTPDVRSAGAGVADLAHSRGEQPVCKAGSSLVSAKLTPVDRSGRQLAVYDAKTSLALVRSGETGRYEMLMRRYNQRLFRVIRSVVTDDLEAEDILQESWVRAYEYLDRFEGRASFSTWVTRIGFHEALARNRNSKRWTPLESPE
jgi:hypothetical protein